MSSISFQTFNNDFQICEKLGKGANASVYRIQKVGPNKNPQGTIFKKYLDMRSYALKLIELQYV